MNKKKKKNSLSIVCKRSLNAPSNMQIKCGFFLGYVCRGCTRRGFRGWYYRIDSIYVYKLFGINNSSSRHRTIVLQGRVYTVCIYRLDLSTCLRPQYCNVSILSSLLFSVGVSCDV